YRFRSSIRWRRRSSRPKRWSPSARARRRSEPSAAPTPSRRSASQRPLPPASSDATEAPRRRARLSGEFEPDVLLTTEKRLAPEGVDIFEALGEGQEVVARKRSRLRREAHIAVGQQELRLADAARIEDDLARRRVAGVVFKRDAKIELAERDPDAFAAPANVNDLADERHVLEEGRHSLRRCCVLKMAKERIWPGNDSHFAHAALLGAGGLRPGTTSRRTFVFCLDVRATASDQRCFPIVKWLRHSLARRMPLAIGAAPVALKSRHGAWGFAMMSRLFVRIGKLEQGRLSPGSGHQFNAQRERLRRGGGRLREARGNHNRRHARDRRDDSVPPAHCHLFADRRDRPVDGGVGESIELVVGHHLQEEVAQFGGFDETNAVVRHSSVLNRGVPPERTDDAELRDVGSDIAALNEVLHRLDRRFWPQPRKIAIEVILIFIDLD